MKITKEEFFKMFELDLQRLVIGNEGISVAKPKHIYDYVWKMIVKNKVNLDEIIKVSENFAFTTEDYKFVFNKKMEIKK